MRKWVWVGGSILQCVAVLGMGLVAFTLHGAAAGWSIIALLVLFSLARGLCSVAHKDVLGKAIPKTRRGRLTGYASSVAGLLALGIGVFLTSQGDAADSFYGILLAAAGLLWLLAAAVFALVQEQPGATEGGGNALREAVHSLDLLRTDSDFRRFVIVRSLLLCSALSAPYYVILASERGVADISTLGWFVVANGLASSLSAPFWGRLADASSKTVMVRAALLTAGLGLLVAVLSVFLPALVAQTGFYPAAYFVLGIAHSGVRLGRKTYIVDMAGGNKRTDYIEASNTVIGLVLLGTGLIGALAGLVSALGVIVVLSLLGLAGALLGRRLPEV